MPHPFQRRERSRAIEISMPDLRLSVRARLLAVCLGLMAVFGGTSVLLGYLIFRNQADQRAIEEQYRRFERIQTVQQDVLAYRHEGSQLNVAIMQRDRDRQAQAQAATDRAAAQLERSLGELQGFDPDAAAAIRDELRSGLEQKSSAAIAAFVRGDQAEAARSLGQLQRSFAHIEQLLQAATRTQRDLSNDILERGARRAKTASELAIGVLLGGLVFGLLLVRWVARSKSRCRRSRPTSSARRLAPCTSSTIAPTACGAWPMKTLSPASATAPAWKRICRRPSRTGAARAHWRCLRSTSTTSVRSTTDWVIAVATVTCWKRSRACVVPRRHGRGCTAPAATSSRCCSTSCLRNLRWKGD